MASGIEALPLQALHLQGAEQRLATGIVPTIGPPAHGVGNAVIPELLPEALTGVLAAPVAVEHQPGMLVRVTPEPGHAQRVNHDARRHVLAQGQAHHLAAEQVDHHC